MAGNTFIKGSMDDFSGHLIAMDEVHARIHEGVMYSASAISSGVADNGDLTILVRTVAGQPAHLRIEGGAGGDAQIELYENPTITDDGSALSTPNRNRISTNTASTLMFTGPTASDDGTGLLSELQPGGSGFFTPGASRTGFEEWVLKANEEYLIRITNLAGTAQDLGLSLTFYEDGS